MAVTYVDTRLLCLSILLILIDDLIFITVIVSNYDLGISGMCTQRINFSIIHIQLFWAVLV